VRGTGSGQALPERRGTAVRQVTVPESGLPGAGRGPIRRRLQRATQATVEPVLHLRELIDVQAARLLGISGEEFRRRWYAGVYRHDGQPAVRALDHLMRTGQWRPPLGEATQPG
jgi:hypothetical protein